MIKITGCNPGLTSSGVFLQCIRIILVWYFMFLFVGCQNSTHQELSNVVPDDTIRSFRIGDLWLTPKTSFDLNAVGRSDGDTLDLVTCSDYVYFPFGKISNKIDLKNSLLKDFNTVERIDSLDNGIFEFQVLKFNSSRLILFFDADPEVISSYILKGEVNDKNVQFVNNITIGMRKEEFVKEFFESFPQELIHQYKVIILESCVSGLNHVYTFKDNKLYSIKFNCIECCLNLDY